MLRHALATVLALAAPSAAAFGRTWSPAEDQEVVRRAEVIVVGRLEDGSVQFVPHATREHEGRSWEHHATLVVSEVLKGTLAPGKTTVVIHYGLDVLVDGRFEQDGSFTDVNS